MDVSEEPQQTPYTSDIHFTQKIGDLESEYTPIAKYKIAAVVGSKKNYTSTGEWGDLCDFVPVDLLLVWGKLAKPKQYEHLTFDQYGRWGYINYESDIGLSSLYVETHFSNSHIIPANDNVIEGINAIKKDQIIILEGYLVTAAVTNSEGFETIVSSSLTRGDQRDGACELIYVERVTIDDTVYA